MSDTPEALFSIKQAASVLQFDQPLTLAALSKLGKEASMVARIWQRPTGTVTVVGEAWPTEKAYTQDVLREVFSRNPLTASALAAHSAATGS